MYKVVVAPRVGVCVCVWLKWFADPEVACRRWLHPLRVCVVEMTWRGSR